MSTFDGEIIEFPGVCVDNFDNDEFRIYLLSHCHTDHLQGLIDTPKFHSKIYCSELSAHFIRQRYPQHSEQLKIVQIGSPTYVKDNDTSFQLTFLPSGHCAGACMILLQDDEKDVLYTGDFRMSKKEVENIKSLRDLKNLSIYIDSTFMKKSYMHFPTQSESVKVIIEEIEKFLKKSKSHKVNLVVPAKIGYEHLIIRIHEKLKEKIFIDEAIDNGFEFISELRSCLSKDEEDSKVFLKLKPRNGQDMKKDKNYLDIKLSAMIWANWKTDEKFIRWENDKSLRICYATHCSFTEIKDFLTFLKPSKVHLNVLPANGPQRLEMKRDIIEIQSTYIKKPETIPQRPILSFKRIRENSSF